MKQVIQLLIIGYWLLVLPTTVLGQVVINEFSAIDSPDRFELYNLTNEPVVVDGWYVKDGSDSGNRKNLSGILCPWGFLSFDYSNSLNRDGDTISLYSNNDNLVDRVIYFDNVVPIHSNGQSTGRVPDGSASWQVITSPDYQNSSCDPSPTPTPEPSTTPTPTAILPTNTPRPTNTPTTRPTATNIPTPTSSNKSTYKINEVKNNSGGTISSVQIYVDGNYIHHYAPEELTFCPSCECYSGVPCGLGEHTIRLDKTGYLSWSEKKDFTAGSSWTIDPVMTAESSATNTPIPTKTPTPSPTGKLTPTPSIKETPTPSIEQTLTTTESVATLVSEPSLSPAVLGETTDASPRKKLPIAALGIIGGGVLFLGLGVFSYIKGKN